MPATEKHIPTKSLAQENGYGIVLNQLSPHDFGIDEELRQAHRHDHHIFVLQEQGISSMEIDFEQYDISSPAIFYQSPKQVHRALKIENLAVCVLTIDTEHISNDYRKLLSQLAPTKPLLLDAVDLAQIKQAFALAIDLYGKAEEPLYFSMLKDSCHTIIALMLSQYLKLTKSADKLSRFEMVEGAFSTLLEDHFSSLKRPAAYAEKLHISVAYLNECIKQVTGLSVSQQIQQRVILEAKRLLYHSNSSVKEIATLLGYDDYAYFSRLFAKATGMTALSFRNKNRD
ncbi:MAG: AraC family transcriptional regulator [Chitinophagaceae bacterium]|nr:MAG: AraC family transcriptional regulator [Chitinophagaceae bacterium]